MTTTSNPASGSDAGSDLFHNDTHAGGAHAVDPGEVDRAATGRDSASEADGSRFTVEDTGSPTDASDLVHDGPDPSDLGRHDSGAPALGRDGSDPGAPEAPAAPERPQAPSGGLAALADDPDVGHVFDQTNGVIDGLDGDSDGTAESDVLSAGERAVENPAFEAHTETEPQRGDGVEDTRRIGS
jgi:hypothetical protein